MDHLTEGLRRPCRGVVKYRYPFRKVLVIQGGQRASLALEALHVAARWKNLQRDVAPQSRVARAIYFAHPARPERGKDFVRPQTSSSGEGH